MSDPSGRNQVHFQTVATDARTDNFAEEQEAWTDNFAVEQDGDACIGTTTALAAVDSWRQI